MAIKVYKPTTPARRGMTSQDFGSITTKKPVRSLLATKTRSNGRNNQGRITTRHKGGGARQFYRLINFNLEKGTEATIEHIEYDPNRSARIARLKDSTGKFHYVIAAHGMKIGQKVTSNEEAPVEIGNRMQLKNMPVGSTIYAVELQPGRGAQLARSAGNSAQLIAKDEEYAQVRLPSGEVRLVRVNCSASIGVVGNEQHQNVKIGKAGRSRSKGVRPTVRGVAMNAADHPHGGGEGKHGLGGKHGRSPKTPWGQKTLGYKTRRRKSTEKFIMKSRHSAKRR